ncbi:AAA family ATPase [Acidobacteria bacterium AH-259-L09]|nr:AAA family ATPase [Acidobacteria bacterium AH-259-L09]
MLTVFERIRKWLNGPERRTGFPARTHSDAAGNQSPSSSTNGNPSGSQGRADKTEKGHGKRTSSASSAPKGNESADTGTEYSNLKRKWGVYRHGDLKQRCQELGSGNYLIKDFLPERSLGLVVGHSGLGKSPYLYQAALCVAAGKPFLGHAVRQGKVLYLDFENGLGQVAEMIDSLLKHVGLKEAPENLVLWNLNDSSPKWGQTGYTLRDMVQEVEPDLVILDSITAYHPDIEDTNSTATKVYQHLRKLIRDTGASIWGVHHLRKPSNNPKFAPVSLETASIIRWFHQARGAGALINGCDVRLGVDVPTKHTAGQGEEIALAVRGFGRVRGEIPLTYLARIRDKNGEPLGYKRMTGVKLLFNKEQEETFAKLPDRFRFKDAQQTYSKGAQATTDFLNKCISCGIVRKVNRAYEKVPE